MNLDMDIALQRARIWHETATQAEKDAMWALQQESIQESVRLGHEAETSVVTKSSDVVGTALIDSIIRAYHTTRMRDTPAATHILSKSEVQGAFARYNDKVRFTPTEDFLTRLRRISAERATAWAGGEEIDPLFHATELGGEVGEVLNVAKKLYRERMGWRGSRATVEQLADEMGDVLICLDKLAAAYGIDLAAATAKKFDETSVAVGLPQRMGAA